MTQDKQRRIAIMGGLALSKKRGLRYMAKIGAIGGSHSHLNRGKTKKKAVKPKTLGKVFSW